MSSLRRIAASAIRHGLQARCVVLGNESRATFDALLQEHLDRLAPVDGVEFGLLEDLAAAFSALAVSLRACTRNRPDCPRADSPVCPVSAVPETRACETNQVPILDTPPPCPQLSSPE